MSKKVETFQKIYIITNLFIMNIYLYHFVDFVNRKENNPYHDVMIDLNSKTNKEKQTFLKKYFNDLSNYQLIRDANYFDEEMINNLIKICSNNEYVNYNYMADSASVSVVTLHNVDKKDKYSDLSIGGRTLTITSNLFNKYLEKEIHIYENLYSLNFKDVYYHEMLHSIFPSIIDSKFFEETLTSIMTKEYCNFSSGYNSLLPITKMWIETLGEDVFMNMHATGEIDKFLKKLLDLGYSKEKIKEILKNLDNIIKLYSDLNDTIESREHRLEKEIEKAIVNVSDCYQKQYSKSIDDNIIMKAYKFNLLNDDITNEYYRYYVNYFTSNENGEKIYQFDDKDNLIEYDLDEDDYNLVDGEPKVLKKEIK